MPFIILSFLFIFSEKEFFAKDIIMVYNNNDMILPKSSIRGRRMDMNCKEEEKMIPAFLQDDLEYGELQQFIKHIEDCPECKEELSIQFLVSEGLERLEAGNSFNLQSALSSKLGDAKHQVNVRQGLQYTLFCLEVSVAAAILISLIIVFIL